METNPELLEVIEAAGVLQQGHFVLNSGLHTDVKVDMERLITGEDCMPGREVMNVAMNIAMEQGDALMVPVPQGALDLALYAHRPHHLDIGMARKLEKRTFTFESFRTRELIRQAGRLAIFEDVVTTGATPAALAHEIRTINPTAEIDLIVALRRGELNPKHLAPFRTVSFLTKKDLPTWQPQDCPLPHES